MSVQAMGWAFKVRTGSNVLKSVLVAVANYADEEGVCWPSQARLARDTELSDRTVREALARLEKMGLMERTRRTNEDGYRASDRIRLNPSYRKQPPLGPMDQQERDADRSNRSEVPVGLPEADDTPTGRLASENGREVPSNHHEPSRTITPMSPDGDREPEEKGYPVEFEGLWTEVPKTSQDPLANPGSKAKAFALWKKLSKANKEACFIGWQAYLEVMEERRKKRPDYPWKSLCQWIKDKDWETYQKDAA